MRELLCTIIERHDWTNWHFQWMVFWNCANNMYLLTFKFALWLGIKKPNILIFGTPFCIIKYRSNRLQNGPFLVHPVCVCVCQSLCVLGHWQSAAQSDGIPSLRLWTSSRLALQCLPNTIRCRKQPGWPTWTLTFTNTPTDTERRTHGRTDRRRNGTWTSVGCQFDNGPPATIPFSFRRSCRSTVCCYCPTKSRRHLALSMSCTVMGSS